MEKVKNILVPVDFSDTSSLVVDYAKKTAKAFDGSITLLYVVKDTPKLYYFGGLDDTSMSGMLEAEQEHATKMLKQYQESFVADGIPAEILILMGEPGDKIIDYTEEHLVNLIVMGSQGIGSAVRRVFLGSVASRVLHHTKVPVMLVR